MSRKEMMKKSLEEGNLMASPVFAEGTLESPIRDFQKGSVRDLYKKEMDIIVEGFGNI